MTQNNICVQCGRSRGEIQAFKYLCCTETNTESGREVDYEWPRHRFKPYSEKELATQARDEAECIKQMGEMAEFFEREMKENT